MPQVSASTIIYTALALFAFAGNSVLCRLALQDQLIDAASFTAIRLISGACVLFILLAIARAKAKPKASAPLTLRAKWLGPVSLFVYAVAFSYAYISLETGIGALILFASVQLSLVAINLWQGKTPLPLEWCGIAIAFGGFVYLVYPTLSQPSFYGFILMVVAGIAWGFYTLAGRNSSEPLTASSFNFSYSVPLSLLLLVFTVAQTSLTWEGIGLAVLTGGLTSGVGYALWYKALEQLSLTLAGVLQLLVPVIAAVGGILFAGEAVSQELLFGALLIIGGIALMLLAPRRL